MFLLGGKPISGRLKYKTKTVSFSWIHTVGFAFLIIGKLLNLL